jgi:hypothetical protein
MQAVTHHSTTDLRECPHDWGGKYGVGGVFPLSDAIKNIPEFNDCQRFLIRGNAGLAYGALYAIFASPDLGTLPQRLAMRQDRFALGAGEVWADSAYAPLGISRGYNCLFLWREQGKWKASMVSPKREDLPDTICTDSISIASTVPGRHLLVIPKSDSLFKDADYPAVARWDWDHDHRKQYLGLKCGPAWCEVGDLDLTPSPDLPGPVSSLARRSSRIKGYYDQQYLASVPAPGLPSVPTGMLASIIPVDSLGDWHSWSTFSGFRTVAHVQFTGRSSDAAALAAYTTRFGFTGSVAGTVLQSDRIDIALCYGTPTSCGISAASMPATCAEPGPGDDPPLTASASFTALVSAASIAGSNRWYSRVKSGGSPMYHCITRYDVPIDSHGIATPGTTRWRWMANDEGGWFRCLYGCCELTDE